MLQKYDLPKPHPRTDKGEREFDKTQLKSAGYAHQVHRDYAAHYFRWGFAGRFSNRAKTILEIGCGQDLPLFKVLASDMSSFPKKMVSVDLNKIKLRPSAKWLNIVDEFNFIKRHGEILKDHGKFDLIVSFEVIEHMDKANGKKLLSNAHALLADDGQFLLSTPVYNGRHMAANHIHEYQFQELKDSIEAAGFAVEKVHGTFMDTRKMKKACTPAQLEIVNAISAFYSNTVVSNFLAPMFPEIASNCCWVLRKNSKPRQQTIFD